MKRRNPSLPHIPSADWQILGELQLPVGSHSEDTLSAWLIEILNPLDLHGEFLSKILKSAQEAIVRAMQAETVIDFEHLHLLVLAPLQHASDGRTWGFFRIEKVESAIESKPKPDHAIEFYLYMEGNQEN